MSKITRKKQLIFGQSAGAQQIAQYGSLAAGSPAYSTDPAVIQSLSNWLTGWYGGAVGGNSPAIEDMNAVHYVHSYQLAYLMQTGLPEWDTSTTYFTGSRVNDGNGNVKVSLTDNNTGNALTDGTKWREPNGAVPIGAVVATFPNLTGAYTTTATTVADTSGWVLCGGQTIADATSPMNGQVVPNIDNSIFLMGNTVAGQTGGSNSLVISHSHVFTSTTAVAASGHTHDMSHNHQWAYDTGSALYSIPLANAAATVGRFTTTSPAAIAMQSSNILQNGSSFTQVLLSGAGDSRFTTGALSGNTTVISNTGAPSGTTTVTGTTNTTGTGADSRPSYISAVYLMRIK